MHVLRRLSLFLLALLSSLTTWAPDTGVSASAQPVCRAIVSSLTSPNVSIVDAVTSEVSVFAPNGVTVSATVYHPDGRLFARTTAGNVIVLSAHPNYEVLATVSGLAVRQFAMTPNGQQLYTSGDANQALYWIDTNTLATTNTFFTLGYEPVDLVAAPDNIRLFATGTGSGQNHVTVVSPAGWHNLHLTTVTTSAVAVSPSGSLAYFASSHQPKVLIAAGDPSSFAFANPSEWNVASPPHSDIAISPDGSRAYLTATSTNQLVVVDTASGTTVAAVPVGSAPKKVALTPDGRFAFVTNGSSASVSKVDLRTNSVVQTITVADNPSDISIGPPNCTTQIQQLGEPPSVTPAFRAVLDPAGGTCIDSTPHTETWATTFIGHRYIPGPAECSKSGHVFGGWNDTTTGKPVDLPLLTDPASSTKKHFLATNASLTATWRPLPTAISEFVVFANFFCGPCTNAWFIHRLSDHATSYDYTVNSAPVTCRNYGDVAGVGFCEISGLPTGTSLTLTATPRNADGIGPTATRTIMLNR